MTSTIAGMPESRKLLLFSLMALGQFMALMDIQIVASSINDIQAGLAAGPDESSWVQTAYLMAEIVMIPLSGWLSRAFSTRWLFTASAAAFTVTSVACGLAWNIESMIAFRAIQGFVGGAMIPTVFATGFALFEGKRRAMVPAVLGILGALAPTIGPTLGGYITDTWSWHWLFFINILPGIVIVSTIPILGRVDEPDPGLMKHFDFISLILLAMSLGGLEYVLEEGYRWNWMDDETIRGVAWIAGISGIAFIVRTLRSVHPLVDLKALRNPTFALGCLFNFVTGFGIFAAVYVLPLFLARVRGFNAHQIGNAVFIAGVAMVASAPIAANLSRRLDLRIMIAFGLCMFAAGLWMMSFIASEWTGAELFWPQVVRGFAILFCIVPATNMALGSVAPERLKMASALFNTMRNLGGAVGIAAVNTVLNDRLNLHWLRLNEHMTGASATIGGIRQHLIQHGSDATQAGEQAIAMLARLVRREATTLAFADVLWLMAMLFVLALPLVLLVRPVGAPTPAQQVDAH
ncbi:DHA2 family multidrug resistance protein [Luteibacter rhizovicinus]|uniref:DHA2 family multidrug resistance protein n=1 Tax=Luteibacter rhizovicinus TaxID=242606 RepID=A0A4R3YPR0_9GAMM|nr:DHA2 family efflux MFS transporter permease subunit [Luteibacter rhizovicinus]TCV92903.1 DHA2 family multidrug resistance protein [Luteibacter rhizovicinus]